MTLQEDSQKITDLLARKFSIKDVGLSYRIVNDWSEKGLLDHLRKDGKGWHRFSFSELIEILIYKELRSVGFSIKKLKNVKSYLNKNLFEEEEHAHPFELNNLAICVCIVLAGQNNFLIMDTNASKIGFFRDIALAELLSRKNPSYVKEYGNNNSLIVLNLRKLFDSLRVSYQITDEKLGLLMEEMLSETSNQELKVLTDGFGNIRKVKAIKYGKLSSCQSVNKLVNQPNQKTTFHSNKHGAQRVTTEKELK